MGTNHLANAASAYLRSAVHQPVDWHPWGAEAFTLAQQQNKPILLDIGAVWCHWCHVMDRESYENQQTADLINQHFIAIKVDRDERPEVDTRYQAAVSAISGQGGWPLTAFLTPEGKPYFGGTYFPPEDRYGRPSFQRVLQTMADAFRDRRDEVNDSAGSVMDAIEYNESFSGRSGDLGAPLLDKLVESMLKQFDPQYGGFGSQPKFPHPAALDLLIDLSSRPIPLAAAAQTAAGLSLQKIARGGMRDHLGGGFHRYSVDEKWIVPHFEKMAYDNATLLSAYTHGFATYVDIEFAETARETMRFIDESLSDRVNGGFYGSQDADLNLEDDGDYFTWTRNEAAAVLTPEELTVAELWYDIGEIGDMHHDPTRNVLHIKYTPEEVATRLRQPLDQVATTLASLTEKLRKARAQRSAPFIDKALYTGWNALCISAYLDAGRVLLKPDAITFAIKSLDRVLTEAWTAKGLNHIVSTSHYVSAILDDYAFLGIACIDAWEATGKREYLTRAEEIGNYLLANFHDKTGGGFFDTQESFEPALGALAARRKPLQDSPTPSGNSATSILLLRLADWTGRDDLRTIANDTLETFAGIVEHFGLYAATYGLALQRFLKPAVQIVILGDDAIAAELEIAALARYAVNKAVVRIHRDQLGDLPPSLAETIPHLSQEGSLALVCGNGRCLPPITDAETLVSSINEML